MLFALGRMMKTVSFAANEVTRRARDAVWRRGVDGDLASVRERLLRKDCQDDGVLGRVIGRLDADWLVHGTTLLLGALVAAEVTV